MRERRRRRTWRSSGNAFLTSAGINSVGKARSKSLSSVKGEDEVIVEAMMEGGGCEGTQRISGGWL